MDVFPFPVLHEAITEPELSRGNLVNGLDEESTWVSPLPGSPSHFSSKAEPVSAGAQVTCQPKGERKANRRHSRRPSSPPLLRHCNGILPGVDVRGTARNKPLLPKPLCSACAASSAWKAAP